MIYLKFLLISFTFTSFTFLDYNMFFLLATLLLTAAEAKIVVFSGIAGSKHSADTAVSNTALLNTTFASLSKGDTLIIPNETFTFMGGIYASGLDTVTLQIDGTLEFTTHIKDWPLAKPGKNKMPKTCVTIENSIHLTITSNGTGTLDGNGATWWGIPGVGYLLRGKNRPPLIHIGNATDFLFEHILLLNSPRFHFTSSGLQDATIRHSQVSARRTTKDSHGSIDLTAFNTDGFDVSGDNIHIYDCEVWNQDDTFCIKDSTTNVVVENVRASGVGLSIGSIGNKGPVRNITFRNIVMHHTDKGIYMKFRSSGGRGGIIEDILYENIYIDQPESWPIWIGPAQQDIKEPGKAYNPCHGDPCSLCWPTLKSANCDSPPGTFRNIMLRNITVNKPKTSAGVIFGNFTNPIQNLTFDGVRFIDPVDNGAWGKDHFYCKGVENGVAIGDTFPVPPCFANKTLK